MPSTAPPEPRLSRLPFADTDFSWLRFEQFWLGVVAGLPGVRSSHRYGQPGESDLGVDVVALHHDGSRTTYQCRCEIAFHPSDVDRTIEETKYAAQRHVIVVTCPVTRAVRDQLDGLPDWELWDIDDISTALRKLPRERARHLVEDAFGAAVRRQFLGPAGSLSFLPPERFFRALLNEDHLFHHAWPLVGHEALLDQLVAFGKGGQGSGAILVGRGGTGKTRLLRELAERLDGSVRMLFADDALIEVTREAIEELPLEPCLVVLDDVHLRHHLAPLFHATAEQHGEWRLLLATRPQRVDGLLGELARTGHDPGQIVRHEVRDLASGDVETLARSALGPAHAEHAETLARLTGDCPLVTVVAGKLMARDSLAPMLLDRDENFRATVLGRFRDERLGSVGDRVPPAKGKRLLELVAALAPLSTESDAIVAAVARFVGAADFEVRGWLGAFEEAGIVLRRGRLVRIAPDVLSNHILHEACFAAGAPTGFADAVYSSFHALGRQTLLRNLAELDWRESATGNPSALLDRIWADVETHFDRSSTVHRGALLDELAPVAAYLPDRMLRLVERAIAHPAPAGAPEESFAGITFGPEIVLEKLPPLLRSIAYSPRQLPRAVQLLWDLGRDQPEGPGRGTQPLDVLRELIAWDLETPVGFNSDVLDALEPLLRDPAKHGARVPHELLAPILARTGHSNRYDGRAIQMRPFVVSYERTRQLRERVRRELNAAARGRDLRVAMAAARSLANALTAPRMLGGVRLEATEMDQWLPEQHQILEEIGDLLRTSRPAVRTVLRDALAHEVEYGVWPDCRDRARALNDEIAPDLDERVVTVLLEPWSLRDIVDDQADHAAVANMLSRRLDFAEALEHRIATLRSAGETPEPGPLLLALGFRNPEAGAQLAAWILKRPRSPLVPGIGSLLGELRRLEHPSARLLLDDLLRRRSLPFVRAAAAFYAGSSWIADVDDRDHRALSRLCAHAQSEVRRDAIVGLSRLIDLDPAAAKRALVRATGRGPRELAGEILGLLGGHRSTLGFDAFSARELRALLSKLANIASLDWHSLTPLLHHIGGTDPDAVVDFLLARLDHAEEDLAFRALPVEDTYRPPLPELAEDELARLLRRVRDRYGGVDHRTYGAAELFWALAGGLTDTALFVVHEWLASEDPKRLDDAAELLSDGPAPVLVERPAFAADALERAAALGEEPAQRMRRTLVSSALSGGFSRIPGHPSSRHVTVRDAARDLAQRVPAGSPARHAYDELAEAVEDHIDRELQGDEEKSWLP